MSKHCNYLLRKISSKDSNRCKFPALAAYEKNDTQMFPKISLLLLSLINAQPKMYWFYIGNIARDEKVKEFSSLMPRISTISYVGKR